MSLKREPKELKDIFNSMPNKLNLNEKVLLADLRKNIEQIMSNSFKDAVTLYDLNNGVLRLKITNSAWRTEIQLRKVQIVDKFNEYIGSNAIKSIVLH